MRRNKGFATLCLGLAVAVALIGCLRDAGRTRETTSPACRKIR
jgi:hypothetical protein